MPEKSEPGVLGMGRTRKAALELPWVLLSAAVSLDGFLDDVRGRRLVLSSDEDIDSVDALRAQADAIVIGAATARRDDPSLIVRAPVRRKARELAGERPTPMRVVVTQTGNAPRTLRLFNDHDAPTLVVCPAKVESVVVRSVGGCAEVVGLHPCSLERILRYLYGMGCRRVLIEGGERLSSAILARGLFHELRLAVAPILVGAGRSPRFGGRLTLATSRVLPMRPWRVEALGSCAVTHWTRSSSGIAETSRFLPANDAQWLAEAVQLARRCVPSPRAYSVGAILVGAGGAVISTGYSRELDPRCHAEEAALRKARALGVETRDATLYSSMEPCSVRLSGRESCSDRVVNAGIRRVVYAMREPPVFVQCDGHERLQAAGVEVVEIPELASYAGEFQQHLTH